jgi:hypothetical protein
LQGGGYNIVLIFGHFSEIFGHFSEIFGQKSSGPLSLYAAGLARVPYPELA